MLPLEERRGYSSGGVSWARLPVLVGGAFAAAVAAAWFLYFAFVHEFYLIMLLACIVGFALGGVMYGLVVWSHCRNRWLAGLIGLAAGAGAYLGYYEFCLAAIVPPGMEWRVDF